MLKNTTTKLNAPPAEKKPTKITAALFSRPPGKSRTDARETAKRAADVIEIFKTA